MTLVSNAHGIYDHTQWGCQMYDYNDVNGLKLEAWACLKDAQWIWLNNDHNI